MRVAFGEYRLDTKTRTLQREGRRIPVQSKAFDLLAYLIERRDQVVSPDELLDSLWPGLHVTPAALSTAVQKARQAVGDDGEHQTVLRTEHGKGFRFVAEVTDLSPPGNARPGSTGTIQAPLFAELKRRNVFRVAAAYGIVSWLLVEVASVVVPALRLPEWALTLLVFLVIAGFPLALILAWAFELTPEGIKREAAVDPAESITQQTGRRLDFAIIALLALAVVLLVVDHYFLEADREQTEAAAEPALATEPVARGKSIAVLPFDNISPNPEDAYFADGIHDEVLAQLSRIRDLKVISRTSVMRYSGKDRPSLPQIAAELGVANILEGSVRLAGNRVRITTQLIEAQGDAHLWTETYDRELTAVNIFAIQSDVAETVADALQAALSPEEKDRLATTPTENLAAYQAYMLGKQQLRKLTSSALEEAGNYFQRAIDLDPNFALAYVGLADTHTAQVWSSGLPPEELLANAQAATDKALELDAQLGEAYNSLAQIKWTKRDSEGAEVAFRRALELNPNYGEVYSGYGELLRDVFGRPEEALALHRKAIELDPLSAAISDQLGRDLSVMGRPDEALAWLKKALDVNPDHPLILMAIVDHYWYVAGQLDEAVVWLEKARSIDPGDPSVPANLGWVFLDLGDLNAAQYWIERSIALGPDSRWTKFALGMLHLYRDDEATLDYLRKSPKGLTEIWPHDVLLRLHWLRAGRYSEFPAIVEKRFPALLKEDSPRIASTVEYSIAIDLALPLSKSGEQERAELLLNRSLHYIQTLPRLGFAGYWIADVQIYALQGEKQKALAALRQAIDEGWRTLWWYFLKYDPTLESLHDEPEYQVMVAEIEANMAAQLERVREMERNGELEPIPEAPTATQ